MPENYNIPYQIQALLEQLSNKKDNVHVRANYRMRLDVIRREIDNAIRSYDNEVAFQGNSKRKA